MEISIEKIQKQDAEELFNFESENRAYFEKYVPSRGEEYYGFETFQKRHKELLEEQEKGISYFYLIKDQTGSIVGRMNLVDIDRNKSIGHIGYRVGEIHTGKRIANKALKLLLMKVSMKNIKQVHAKTTSNNIASQKVLEKNGFTQVSTSNEEFIMNAQNVRFVYFMWSNT
ncbi:GNAT family N-acetyltransferase [Psychrobacillus sp. OK032]|uniref:GNAT family N-acetyltransferase n=1 Tax=Psychrobacillus sp. OK032 TaxID=1884358 RepID=UPI0008BB94AC|nr:GNAT family protein [Psychrobacillus sp. OK032]SES12927.1 ribosomal-protein-alanine N-acetyltransferase [Psychrobacillus sp. OK032]